MIIDKLSLPAFLRKMFTHAIFLTLRIFYINTLKQFCEFHMLQKFENGIVNVTFSILLKKENITGLIF